MVGFTTDDGGVVVLCDACRRRVAVPYRDVGGAVRCGHCAAIVPPTGEPVAVGSEAAFDALVGSCARPVLVDFWAGWCGPCHMVAPELEKVAEADAGRLVVAKVNTDDLPDVAQRFRICSVPTLALFVGGREIFRAPGALPAEGIRDAVARALDR